MTTTTYPDHPVHPAAAVFPMMDDAELDDLAKDIGERGLLDHIVLWRSGAEPNAPTYLLDGRNRLAALDRLGRRDLARFKIDMLSWDEVSDPASYVISRNIKRRHLTKSQQAELILKAIEATVTTDRANVAPSVPRDAHGHVQGSTKDPVLAAAVDVAKPLGISKRTVQRARAKDKTETAPARPSQAPGGRGRVRHLRAVATTEPPAPAAVENDLRTALRQLHETSQDRWTTAKQARIRSTMNSVYAALKKREELVEWMLEELARLAGRA